MPLVVPGVTTQSGDPTEHWTNKLVGKKLHDEHNNETVSARFQRSAVGSQLGEYN